MRQVTRPRGYSPLRQPSHCRRGLEVVGIAKGTDNLAGSADRRPVVHLVADVVEMEEIVDPVAAYPELVVLGKGIAHRGEEAALESVEGGALLLFEPTPPQQPLLGLGRGELALGVDA